ncbi:chondroitinase-B domain-containing protein [Tamlana sp. 2201CG12-4]|uniref:chondroitinase-B domain-containing protein n=1 Tax=Tamlana sp. 2201CG12-4 TaxID=3112582 RepID=UPI002DBC4368|nr:chondroitinase-B domain-containing protein [Tamlana sp. 2201CG12-4]MEC3908797.1 chondroitinase-B domain-containing protein [Tamlana sp. 2201CG12-4]
MKQSLSILLGVLFTVQLMATDIPVSTAKELKETISKVKAGDRIILADGDYADMVYYLRNNGTKEQPIIIEAKHPGKAVFTGKSGFYVYGRHWIIKGLFFKDGQHTDELYTITHPAQYNVIVIYGDYVRITECAFHNFYPEDVGKGRYISAEFGPNGFPQYTRIDHCSFVSDKRIIDGQFLGINNTFPSHVLFKHNEKRARFFEKDNDYVDILKNYPDAIADAGQPMYARVDNNYFGIYGGSISRWGHYGEKFDLREINFFANFKKYSNAKKELNIIEEKYKKNFESWQEVIALIPQKYRKKYYAYGSVVFDGNLVEGNRKGDTERVCSKVGQNIYYNNTFYNDRGQLSLRAGSQEVIIDNYFMSEAPFKEGGAGQIVGWGQLHTVVGNYFRVNKNAGLAMTSGREGIGTGHDSFVHGVIAYNTFEAWSPYASAINLRSSKDRRFQLKTSSKGVEYAYATIYGNLFKGNTFINTSSKAVDAYHIQYLYGEMIDENDWIGNYAVGDATLAKHYKTNPQWHLMTPVQLKTIEESELTNEPVDLPGVEHMKLSELKKNKAGLYVNPNVKREKLKIKDIPTFPYSISDLCEGKLVPVKHQGRLLPGVLNINLSGFGEYSNDNRPLDYDDVGPEWLKGVLSKIGPEIRYCEIN